MLKRILLIALVLSLACAPAFAAGKLTVNQERMIAFDSYGSVEADVYAEVENTGDKPVEFSAGLVELFDADGNTLDSTDYVYCYPSVLAPGEKGFVYVSMYPENATAAADIADYALTVTGKGSSGATNLMKTSGIYEAGVSDGYWTYNYLTAEVTNETADTVYDLYCVYALKDADGGLLYVYYTSAYSIGIPAGGTLFMRATLPNSVLAFLDANGLTPATVDAIAYESSY
jgi:hypothetical protein